MIASLPPLDPKLQTEYVEIADATNKSPRRHGVVLPANVLVAATYADNVQNDTIRILAANTDSQESASTRAGGDRLGSAQSLDESSSALRPKHAAFGAVKWLGRQVAWLFMPRSRKYTVPALTDLPMFHGGRLGVSPKTLLGSARRRDNFNYYIGDRIGRQLCVYKNPTIALILGQDHFMWETQEIFAEMLEHAYPEKTPVAYKEHVSTLMKNKTFEEIFAPEIGTSITHYDVSDRLEKAWDVRQEFIKHWMSEASKGNVGGYECLSKAISTFRQSNTDAKSVGSLETVDF